MLINRLRWACYPTYATSSSGSSQHTMIISHVCPLCKSYDERERAFGRRAQVINDVAASGLNGGACRAIWDKAKKSALHRSVSPRCDVDYEWRGHICTQYMLLHLVHILYYTGMTSHLTLPQRLAGGCVLQRSLRCLRLSTLGGSIECVLAGFRLVLLHSITMTVPAAVRGV